MEENKEQKKKKVRCLVCKKGIGSNCANYYKGICFAVKVFDEISRIGFKGNQYTLKCDCDYFVDRSKIQHERTNVRWKIFFNKNFRLKESLVNELYDRLETLTMEVNWAKHCYEIFVNVPALKKNGNLELFSQTTEPCAFLQS